ncbi:hypothetical protein [Candidatus Finniella inopinata]|uniref:Toxin-antitoxin system antitoxin subunit n=1 Tax=Candidatus Finniella inopinata TaxID=1696036 RepID=A0A4Q7DJC3_9PROT|nr:hypothetical protein [Candidatus Finniella inopinata]RZI46408.1 hypothetical protein EQU50_02110 [Candidatus Finniella inopinata]
MTTKTVLFSVLEVCKIHEQRLQTALEYLNPVFPLCESKFLTLNSNDLGQLEILTGRFAKLQDLIGSKVFPLLVQAMEEIVKGSSFIDLLEHLEKIELIESVEFWLELRKVRNFVAHEYPDNPKLMVDHLNQIYEATLKLLSYWQGLYTRIQTMNLPD